VRIFGKTLSEYISFQKIFLILILVVGLIKLVLTLAGVENSIVKWLALTAITTLGWLYYSVRVHTSGFGSYKHLLPLLVIQNTLAQSITVVGIAIAIFTGNNNIFTADEFSGFYEGRSWLHAGGHILFGVIFLSLAWWALGSIIMFVTKKILPRGKSNAAHSMAQP
jgi:hypothetical protein